MLQRVASKQAARLHANAYPSSSRLSARTFSSAVTGAGPRPSLVALGKRPLGSTFPLRAPLSAVAVRHFSLTPWRRETPVAESASIGASATAASTPTPDAQAGPSTGTATASAPVDPTVASIASTTPPSVADAAASASDLASSTTETVASTLPKAVIPPDATLGELITANPNLPIDAILKLPEATTAFANSHDLATIAGSHAWYNPAGWTADALVSLHNLTGLPWWATIALLTVGIRAVVFRTVVQGQKSNMIVAALRPQLDALNQRHQAAVKKGDHQSASVYASARQTLVTENARNFFNTVKTPFVQLPIFLSMFYALRKLAETPFPQLRDGGFGWVTDFTSPDPYYVLPVLSMLFTNIVLRIGADGTGAGANTETMKHTKNIISVLTIPACLWVSTFPAAMLWYWTFTNSLTLTQAYFLKQEWVKKALGIPEPPHIPKVPGGDKVHDPSIMDSGRWIVSTFKSQYTQARELQAQAIAAANKEKRGGAAGMEEVIREKKRSK